MKNKKIIPEAKNKPKHPLEWTGERIIPEEGSWMFQRHLKAYQFSMDFCQNKVILDAGCGEGYGSGLLAEVATKVIGVDVSQEAIRHAREKYSRENLHYCVMDVVNMNFADNTFDVIVSFQVIEHLNNPLKFLKQIKRMLKKGGWAIISTPNKSLHKGKSIGKYHVKEYQYYEFMDLLNSYLGKAEYWGAHLKNRRDTAKLCFLDLILKLDIFRIHKLFSPKFRKKIYASIEKTISFDISKTNLKNARDIIGVYRKL